MAKSNIVYRSFRLNLDNEQHCRVNRILAGVNKGIHKSVNQFITDAVDFYARSVESESLPEDMAEQRGAGKGYLSKDDLAGVRDELRDEVKNEIIMLLGAAFGSGAMRSSESGAGRQTVKAGVRENGGQPVEEAVDPTMMELVDGRG